MYTLMRVAARIPIVIKKLPLDRFLFEYIKDDVLTHKVVEAINNDIYVIRRYWEKHPDMRLGQVLINLGYVDDYPGLWYVEEVDWMIKNDSVEPREILYWGRAFDEKMVPLGKTEWILIKDLETPHIESILKGGFTKNSIYLEAFNIELLKRKTEKV